MYLCAHFMRETILHIASQMFLNHGFKSVTMDDIANEMGISKKTIYTHYSNKNDLVKATADYVFNVITSAIEKCALESENPIKELYNIKEAIADLLKDENSSPQHQMQKYYPKIHRELMSRQFSRIILSITDNLERGVQQGLYRKEINIPVIARLYFGALNVTKNEDLFPYQEFSNKMVKDQFLEYHLRGIITPKGEQILNTIIHK